MLEISGVQTQVLAHRTDADMMVHV